ncbi:hypothetical protein YIM1640_22500 [Thermus oshimai]
MRAVGKTRWRRIIVPPEEEAERAPVEDCPSGGCPPLEKGFIPLPPYPRSRSFFAFLLSSNQLP